MSNVKKYLDTSENLQDGFSDKRLSVRLSTLLRFFRILELHPLSIAGVAVLGFIANALSAIGYALLIPFISSVLPTPATGEVKMGRLAAYLNWIPDDHTMSIMLIGATMSLVWGARCLLDYYAGVWSVMQARKLDHNLRIALFSKILIYGKGYYDKKPVAFLNIILNRFTSNISQLTLSVQNFFSACCGIAFYGAILFFISWKLALLVSVLTPVTYIIPHRIAIRLRKASDDALEQYRGLSAYSLNTLESICLTKTFNKETFEQENFEKTLSTSLSSQYEETRVKSALNSVSNITTVFLLLVTALSLPFLTDIPSGRNSIPEILVFFIVLRRVVTSLNGLSIMDIALSTSSGQLLAISRQLYRQNEFLVSEGNEELPPLERGIQFKQLSFCYDSMKALDNLNIFIPVGQHSAIVGRNGSGKSTIADLIMRHYEVPDGKLLIDDQDIKQFSHDSIRSRITHITQKTYLRAASIRENLIYGSPKPDNISDDEIIAVLERAGLARLIEGKEHGLDTPVAPNGDGFSGGEIQMISVARAFFRPADIYILDEVATSLDEYASIEVRAALKVLTKGKTCVTITHRLADIIDADNVLVIKEGRLIESGTVRELLAGDNEFSDIWHRQNKV
jgi:ABC-type multidrug transport system fused ATPase/permease subunit